MKQSPPYLNLEPITHAILIPAASRLSSRQPIRTLERVDNLLLDTNAARHMGAFDAI
jgi:hypothetical protein